jgi:hypothetical protein
MFFNASLSCQMAQIQESKYFTTDKENINILEDAEPTDLNTNCFMKQ